MTKIEYEGSETWVSFEGKPDREVLDRLKEMGFKMSGKRKAMGIKKHVSESELAWLLPYQVFVEGEAAEAAQASAELEELVIDLETASDLYQDKWYLHIETGSRKRIKEAVRTEDDPTMLRFMLSRIRDRRNADLVAFGVRLIEKRLAKLLA